MSETTFDEEFDVVVAGYGFAGAVAAIEATNGGRIPDDVTRAMATGMAEAEGYLRDLADGTGAEITTRPRGGNYPFPHRETFY